MDNRETLKTNRFIDTVGSKNDGDYDQLALQPLLDLNVDSYNYEDYNYDADEDFEDSMPYEDYNTEILNTKNNKFKASDKFLPNTKSFSQHSTSSIHPNSVLPSIPKAETLGPHELSAHNKNHFMVKKHIKRNHKDTKSKYDPNYMLQTHDSNILPSLQETSVAKKSVTKLNIKDRTGDIVSGYTSISDELPRFLLHPVDSYVIRRKSATLVCEVTGADKAYFLCNGEAMGGSAKAGGKQAINRGQHVEKQTARLANPSEDDMSGRMITVKILSLEVTESQIEEFFGLFTCRCDAWNKKGRSSSTNATVEIACKSIQCFFSIA